LGKNGYDLTKLTERKGINRNLVKLFFFNNEDYYNALTDFTENFGRPLAHYTPDFVMNSPDDRALFIKDCMNIRATLMQLGLTYAIHELDVMENALWRGTTKEFSDGQIKFAASINIYTQVIKDAMNE